MTTPPTDSRSLIIGAGGGGKSGGGSARVAQEAADSLRSKAYARVVDLVCEGEIEGLVQGLQSVFLDDTPIQNADGSYNFSGVTLESRRAPSSRATSPALPR
jgi:predicted phage tail protein